MTATIAQAILGAGSVRLNFYNPVTQAWGGLGDPLGADKFEISPKSETKEKTSKQRASYGQSIASVVLGKPTEIAITLSALDREALAAQFQGTLSAWTQGAAASAAYPVTAQLDKWVAIGKRNLVESGLTVTNDAGTTTYVAGTDYEINYWRGEVKAIGTGAITAAQSIKVTAAASAIDGTQIAGGTRPQIRLHAVFEGINQVDGKEIECEAWEAVVTSDAGFDFLASDFGGIELKGTLVIPAGKSEPYVVRMKN